MFILKWISREKRNSKCFCIFCCKNLFLLLRYTRDSLHYEKKKLCLFWMAEAKAPLVSLTLLFSSSFSTTWFKLNKRILYAFACFWICCSLRKASTGWKTQSKPPLVFLCPFGLHLTELLWVDLSRGQCCHKLESTFPVTLSLWTLFWWDLDYLVTVGNSLE